MTISGAGVNSDTAMNFSAFFNGVMQISQTIASLPLILYKRESETKKRRFKEHPLFSILHDKANRFMPSFYWRECSTNHQILAGNSYSYIERDRGLRPVALWLLNPFRTEAVWEKNEMFYDFYPTSGQKIRYNFDDILHIPGFGFDGRKGYSVLEVARESIGLGLSLEEYQARFISQGAHIQGILQTKGQMSPKGKVNLLNSFSEKYGGVGKTAKTILLEEGVEYNKIGMSLTDAQFLESRIFSIQEIARWLNMPPHKLKEQTNATYSNVESENLSFYQDTIRPYLVRQEAFINFKLAPENGYAEYLFDAILRADILTRMRAFQIQRNMGTLNADEIRAYENLNEIEDGSGKYYLVPANMVTVDRIVNPPKPPAPVVAPAAEQTSNAEDSSKGENDDIQK
jgi:HK97 family phage portal protein